MKTPLYSNPKYLTRRKDYNKLLLTNMLAHGDELPDNLTKVLIFYFHNGSDYINEYERLNMVKEFEAGLMKFKDKMTQQSLDDDGDDNGDDDDYYLDPALRDSLTLVVIDVAYLLNQHGNLTDAYKLLYQWSEFIKTKDLL